jgi:ABC-type multidrug transport system fused ATPase/permease subunit
LDPLQKNSDEAIWEVLERTHMKEKVILLPGQLDNTIKNGESFSVGESLRGSYFALQELFYDTARFILVRYD